jgi:hypothetical protein
MPLVAALNSALTPVSLELGVVAATPLPEVVGLVVEGLLLEELQAATAIVSTTLVAAKATLDRRLDIG